MMNKGKRVAFMEPSPSPSSLPPPPPPIRAREEDAARAVYKHQALLQDYHELLRETEAKRRKLQKIIEKRHRLMAEVKFLHNKYQSFSMNRSQATPSKMKKPTHKKSLPSLRFVQPQNSINRNGLPLQDARNKKPMDTVASNTSSVLFDLNKNAEDMEGIQAEREPLKVVDMYQKCSVDGKMNPRDLNLSVFRDVASNGSGLVNKRKISWQDQLALKA